MIVVVDASVLVPSCSAVEAASSSLGQSCTAWWPRTSGTNHAMSSKSALL